MLPYFIIKAFTFILIILGGCMYSFKDNYFVQRECLVNEQLKPLGIQDPRVLKALCEVPRHVFVPEDYRDLSYEDSPLPIGYNQTISQPYIVALMTESSQLQPFYKVLEIGTGCGYQAAILSRLCKEVYTVEIIEPLARKAQQTLESLKYTNIHVQIGDGYEGWPEEAPFDIIMVTAATESIPLPLINQLKVGGTLIMPIGHESGQQLVRITKTPAGIEEEYLALVRFVPMTGRAEK